MKITAHRNPQEALLALAKAQEETLQRMSRLIGKHDDYLARFVRIAATGVERLYRSHEQR